MIDAASQGAVGAVAVIVHIMANLIAFVSLLAFINAALAWFGARIGMIPPDYPDLTFQVLLKTVTIYPLTWHLCKNGMDFVIASLFTYPRARPAAICIVTISMSLKKVIFFFMNVFASRLVLSLPQLSPYSLYLSYSIYG